MVLRGIYGLLGALSLTTGTHVWNVVLHGTLLVLLAVFVLGYLGFLVWLGRTVDMIPLIVALACLPLLLTIVFRRRIKGAVGEFLVRCTLAVWFPRSPRFNDIELPIGSRSTQIDHILVCRRGVFVIETKNWDGSTIHASHGSDQWAMGDKKLGLMMLSNPREQNAFHMDAVAEVLGSTESVFGLVAMVGSAKVKGAPKDVARGLPALVARIRKAPEVLGDADVMARAASIRAACLPRRRRHR